MGGKEASRGFLYQGFASVLKALTDEGDWDKIYIEMPTSNDKVDIALERNNKIVKSIQVKSTKNMFSKSHVKKWLRELLEDTDSPKYELFLIGQCEKTANIFMDSIRNYYSPTFNEKLEVLAEDFDTDLLKDRQIYFSVLPFDMQHLEGLARDSLHKYISHNQLIMEFDKLDFILSATINDQMVSAALAQGVDRKEFDEGLKKRILLLAAQYPPPRHSIAIQSFSRGSVSLEDASKTLTLTEYFNNRELKDGYDWNRDIYEKLKEFLLANTNKEDRYQIFLDTHTSLAFAAGRILDSKSGVNVFPMQKTPTDGISLWDINSETKNEYPTFQAIHEMLNESCLDSAVILNFTHHIYQDVIDFINQSGLPIGRVISCTPNEMAGTKFSIRDGTHAAILASSVYNALTQRTTAERRATLHIFASAPNGLMFFLGGNSRGLVNTSYMNMILSNKILAHIHNP